MTDLHKKSAIQSCNPSPPIVQEDQTIQTNSNQTYPSTPDDLRNVESSAINEEKEWQKHRLKHNMAKYNTDQFQTHKQQNIVNLQDKMSSQFNIRAHTSNTIRHSNNGGLIPTL